MPVSWIVPEINVFVERVLQDSDTNPWLFTDQEPGESSTNIGKIRFKGITQFGPPVY